MTHLETLIAEYLEWQGFLIRCNTKVGRLAQGGWGMELDIIGFHTLRVTPCQYASAATVDFEGVVARSGGEL